jgi:hypothetical protein
MKATRSRSCELILGVLMACVSAVHVLRLWNTPYFLPAVAFGAVYNSLVYVFLVRFLASGTLGFVRKAHASKNPQNQPDFFKI